MKISFSHIAKAELTRILPKKACCRRAVAAGLLFAARSQGEAVSAAFTHKEVSSLLSALSPEAFGARSLVAEEVRVGRKTFVHTMMSARARELLSHLDSGEATPLSDMAGLRCAMCRQSFLRGVFLAIGTLTDPSKAFHAEFILHDPIRADRLDDFLALCGISARRLERKGRIGLYYKNSTAIEELFAEMGANSLVFELMNIKIEKNIRNQENRATNCVARNISRSVDAIAKQVAAIERLKEHGVLEGLDPDLRATAELRLKMDEASLSELSSAHAPPISRSGLNHRLTRLMELAEKIK